MKKVAALLVTLVVALLVTTAAMAREQDGDAPIKTPAVPPTAAAQAKDSVAEATAEEKEDGVQLTAQQQKVLDLVNAERKAAGKEPVVSDPLAQAAADIRAKELATNYSHYRPDGTICFTTLLNLGMDEKNYASENIARGQDTPEEVVKSWMNSTNHRNTILEEKYNKLGVGMYTDASGKTYWTQMFIA